MSRIGHNVIANMHPHTAETSNALLGSCLCGSVRYEVRSEVKAVAHCHCQMCQKAHGAAFGSYGSVPSDDFLVTAGIELMRGYNSSPGVQRTFCGACGSTLTWRANRGAWSSWTSFSLGTLDTLFIPEKHRHVRLASRPCWHLDSEGVSLGASAARGESHQ